MSMNVRSTGADRLKKTSPSQKNSAKKSSTVNVTKNETRASRASAASVSTIDKYFVKGPGAKSKTSSSSNIVKEAKASEVEVCESGSVSKSNSSNITHHKLKAKKKGSKENTPEAEQDLIVIDSDSDLVNATKQNGSSVDSVKKSHPIGKPDDKKVHEENWEPSKPKEKPEQSKQLKRKLKSEDSGGSTDDVDSENEAGTQPYEIDSVQDDQMHVDYKGGDFNTDSDCVDDSDVEVDSKEGEESGDSTKGNRNSVNRKKQNMGNRFRRKETCQGSSSEGETERPWKADVSSRRKRSGVESNSSGARPSRLHPLKRQWSDRDTQQYRAGYPDKKDKAHLKGNLEFYQGKIRSKPDGAFIDDFHQHWWPNTDRLESHHGYIQWLFPIRESGMNFLAQELQLHEAEAIQKDPKAMERFMKSYEMMLNFYGIKLVCQDTGQVARAHNWQPRFRHLNHSMHNYLRITRILKCLGEMGLERFKSPFLKFMLFEAATSRKLDRTLDSCYNYWIGTVKDDLERERLKKKAEDLCAGSGSGS